jgi:hypothetical protein
VKGDMKKIDILKAAVTVVFIAGSLIVAVAWKTADPITTIAAAIN